MLEEVPEPLEEDQSEGEVLRLIPVEHPVRPEGGPSVQRHRLERVVLPLLEVVLLPPPQPVDSTTDTPVSEALAMVHLGNVTTQMYTSRMLTLISCRLCMLNKSTLR